MLFVIIIVVEMSKFQKNYEVSVCEMLQEVVVCWMGHCNTILVSYNKNYKTITKRPIMVNDICINIGCNVITTV